MQKRRLTTIILTFMLCFVFFGAACLPTVQPPIENGGGDDPPPKPPTYHIFFDTGTEQYIESIASEAGKFVYAPSEIPVRDGFKFMGWMLGGEVYSFTVMPSQNITVSARWERLYKITFDSGVDASTVEPLEFAGGEEIILPNNPTRPNHMFLGWLFNTVAFDLTTMPYMNLTLTASWTAASTIFFDTGDGAADIAPLVAVAGTLISAPIPPLHANSEYRFSRWVQENGTPFDFKVMPSTDITLTARYVLGSNLPAMFFELRNSFGGVTNIGNVEREFWIDGSLSVRNAPSGQNLLDEKITFRGRGNGSWGDNANTGKRGYRLRFEDGRRELFGFPSNRHFVLLAGANFDDRTMTKNAAAFAVGREVLDGIEYTSNATWADVYFNGNYHGVYLIAEHVRVDRNRIDVESEYGVLDTGYLIEYDAYATTIVPYHGLGRDGIDVFRADQFGASLHHGFTVKSPDPDGIADGEVTEQDFRAQIVFLREYVSRAMSAVLGNDFETFTELCDLDSWVDMLILHELFKNKDLGWSSLNLVKKPGGKLYMTAPWDFDASAGAHGSGSTSADGFYNITTGAGTNFAQSHNPWWTHSQMYIALWNNMPEFRAAVRARWQEVSGDIHSLLNEMLSDAVIEQNRFALGRNFYHYRNAYGANYNTQSSAETRWEQDFRALRTWLNNRITWLNRADAWG